MKPELTFSLFITGFVFICSEPNTYGQDISPINEREIRHDTIVKLTVEDGDTIKWRKFIPREKFKDFHVKEKFTGEIPTKLDFSTCRWGKRFITRTKDGLKKGAVFAGHFALSEWGCGSSCAQCAIIDLRNGKVYSGPHSSQGKEFYIDSRLIIVNPTDSTGIYSSNFVGNIPEVWLWTEKEFKRLE